MKRIVKAEYLEDYKLIIEFDNGESRLIDLDFVLCREDRVLFRELQDLELFNRFFVLSDSLKWENGAYYSSIFLWELGRTIKIGEYV